MTKFGITIDESGKTFVHDSDLSMKGAALHDFLIKQGYRRLKQKAK